VPRPKGDHMYIQFPKNDMTIQEMDGVFVPPMVTVKQTFDDSNTLPDPCQTMKDQLEALPNHDQWKGKTLCITCGSRGIPGYADLVKTMVDTFKEWGAKPFIIPAMASHGGATAEGQAKMLAGYGITPETMGCPLKSSMEVEQYGEIDGVPLYCDKNAMHADGIVIFNKVKPHTDFRAAHESGLCKMITIGIAKHKGATTFHSFGLHRFPKLILNGTEEFMKKCPIAFGVGLVQNAYDHICDIQAMMPDKLLEADAAMQTEAKNNLAKFKFNDIDLLIIDQIGKNLSGWGHDPNVTGRNLTQTFGKELNLKKLFIRGLTEQTRHMGIGISSADITVRRCLNDIDWDATWTNIATTGYLDGGRIPMYVEDDETAIKLALRTIFDLRDYSKARIVRIKNTMSMSEIQVSEPLYESIKDVDGISKIAGPYEMTFDQDHNLPDWEDSLK